MYLFLNFTYFRYQGTLHTINILSKLAADLLRLMPRKTKPDVSKLIKSPMPGLVKSVSCKTGDLVAENQELLIIGK